MSTGDRTGTALAAVLAMLGSGTLTALFVVQSDPEPLWLWAVFAAAFVGLEISSVEVSDRLMISGSIMAAFTAAVVFGRGSAVLAVALMAAIATLHPDDLRDRDWRRPAANFGQLVMSAVAGVAVLTLFLPAGRVAIEDLPRLAAGAALAAMVYDWVNFGLVSFMVRRLYPERRLRSWASMLRNHVALAVLGAFGGILGAAYVLVGPTILPLILVAYLVGHLGFRTYSRLREAQEDTIRGLIKSLEALDPYTRGHTERVAHLASIAGERLGLEPGRLHVLRWAALIHDVGKVAVPSDLLHKPEPLTEEEERRVTRHMRVVEDVLGRVEFLAPMVSVVSAQHRLLEAAAQNIPAEARVLAVADAFDAMTSTRSYRSAVTQTTAFEQLRLRRDVYGVEAVEALIGAIEASGEQYGPPDADSAAAVERLIRERAIRA